MAFSRSTGAGLVLAAVACAAGALLPPVFAAILTGVLCIAGIATLALSRAEHVLDAIIKQELSPAREDRPKKTA